MIITYYYFQAKTAPVESRKVLNVTKSQCPIFDYSATDKRLCSQSMNGLQVKSVCNPIKV